MSNVVVHNMGPYGNRSTRTISSAEFRDMFWRYPVNGEKPNVNPEYYRECHLVTKGNNGSGYVTRVYLQNMEGEWLWVAPDLVQYRVIKWLR